MDIQIQVKGVDDLVRNLRDLGVNRIPNYVARALTEIANQAQDAMIADARSNLTIRGSWLTKGTKFGINRKAASKNDLTADRVNDCAVADRAGNEDDHHAAQGVVAGDAEDMAARVKAGGNEEPEEHPNTIKLKSKFGNEIIYQRQGSGQAVDPRTPVHPAQADA